MSAEIPDDAWLVVIDMQRVFTGDSAWVAPGYERAAAGIERLLPRFPAAWCGPGSSPRSTPTGTGRLLPRVALRPRARTPTRCTT